MDPQKLYYSDCHQREFTATVTDCRETPKGWAVTLSATAFYPEGGGQACDLGTLGPARVLEVREQEDAILHLCDSPLAAGSTVTGRIDWQRRFDLMQQHSGEHILSGLIHQKYGWHNVGFHIGKEYMEIDFDGPIPQQDLEALEWQANQVIFDDLPVRAWYPSQSELPQVSYRTKKALPWPVRIVDIPGVDACACCGVHVKTTGQIGFIKIVSMVKFHQGVRLQLCCGGRAVRLMQAIFEQNRQVSQAFSAKLLETGEAARKANEALTAEKLRANSLQTAIFDSIARDCAGKGSVLLFRQGLEPGQVRELADKLSATCGGRAAVASGTEGAYSLCMVDRAGDLKPLCEALKQQLNARGGGKPGYFQGSVPATKAQIEALFAQFS